MIIHLASYFVAVTAASFILFGCTVAEHSGDWKLDLDRANNLLSKGKYHDAIILYDNVLRIPPFFLGWLMV